jgi:hypothetical protein
MVKRKTKTKTPSSRENMMNNQPERDDEEPQHGKLDTSAIGNSDEVTGQRDITMVRLKVNPRPYSGNSSWREYLSHFERVSRLNGWNDQLCMDYLWVNLTDSALSYVDNLSSERTKSYSTLCEAMEERFGDKQIAEVFKSELRSRRRQSGESLPALAQDINRLVQRAYPDMGQQGMEELALERFREAIPDQEQRMAVFRSRARTLDQAVKTALETESWQISERSRMPQRIRGVNCPEQQQGDDENWPVRSSRTNELEDKMMKRIEELINAVKIEKTDQVPQSDRRMIPRCYYCNKLGHIERDCRKKKADAKRNAEQSENYEGQH